VKSSLVTDIEIGTETTFFLAKPNQNRRYMPLC